MNDQNQSDTPEEAVASDALFGFCVWRTKYSGGKIGDTVIWADEEAAKFKLAEYKAQCGEWEEAKMERKRYDLLGNGKVQCGRTVYDLRTTTRRELVRQAAMIKLNAEERAALGLSEPNAPMKARRQ